MDNTNFKLFAYSLGAILCAFTAILSLVTSTIWLLMTDHIILTTLIVGGIYALAFVQLNKKVHKIIDNAPMDEIHS